jgi:hypothetical protein
LVAVPNPQEQSFFYHITLRKALIECNPVQLQELAHKLNLEVIAPVGVKIFPASVSAWAVDLAPIYKESTSG